MSSDPDMIRNVVEGALLAAGEPVSTERLLMLFDDGDGVDRTVLGDALGRLEADYEDRGLELREVASGWRIQVREQLSPWVSRLWEARPPKYSRALLETLALIAYQQPVTRGDIEQVRGVTVSSNIVKTLLDRDWIRIVGHRDVPGRPALYGTTKAFLDYFGLRSLDRLPPLSELRDLARINEELGFDVDGEAGQDDAAALVDPDAGQGAPTPADVVPLRAVLGQFEPPPDEPEATGEGGGANSREGQGESPGESPGESAGESTGEAPADDRGVNVDDASDTAATVPGATGDDRHEGDAGRGEDDDEDRTA